MASTTDHLRAKDDGLYCPDVGGWAETKYRLISLYQELFASGMKNKWDERVYIDLYSGAGISRVAKTDVFLKGSPLLAAGVSAPFDKYILCEEDPYLLRALEARMAESAPGANMTLIGGKCDEQIDKICAAIPKASSLHRVLSLCIVDPFDFGLKFQTIKKLSAYYVDFFVLLAVGMDANRNYDHYVDGEHTKIDEAMGNSEWRERWKTYPGGRRMFRQFLAEEFSRSMVSLGYLEQPVHQMKLVKSDEKNLSLYYLALFSRNTTAYKFWDQVLKYSTDQPSLWD
jgi:three-Cys-motif partner protein